MRKIAAIVRELYRSVMPAEMRSQDIDARLDTTAMFSRLHYYVVMDLLHRLDKLPLSILKFTERRCRENRRKCQADAQTAITKQKRFELLRNQLKGFFPRLLAMHQHPNPIKSQRI